MADWESDAIETARVHHPARGRGGIVMAARGASAALMDVMACQELGRPHIDGHQCAADPAMLRDRSSWLGSPRARVPAILSQSRPFSRRNALTSSVLIKLARRLHFVACARQYSASFSITHLYGPHGMFLVNAWGRKRFRLGALFLCAL